MRLRPRAVFTALHPLLLWGTAAVAVPILIHLLLRQRPRPRPWAAMRWLLAAAQAAQRRYKLTNLLLLLLRCLIVMLIALAVARPSIAGIGGGERLVIIIDRSASMGGRGTEPGPLAAAKAELGKGDLAYRRVAVVAVAAHVEPLADGTVGQARDALGRIEASELPGGLDRAAEGANAEAITAVVGQGADVVLVSDFQQDDGSRLEALLTPRCRSVTRLAVGRPSANAAIAAIERLSDLRPGQPGELLVRISGRARGVAVAGDDGAWLPAGQAAEADGLLRVALPPLTPGDHRLRVRIEDDGLAYDNLLELPVLARPAVPALAVGERTDFLAAALKADGEAFSFRQVNPAHLASEPLPAGGVIALRGAVANGPALRDWVRGGGVLWASLAQLGEDAALRELTNGIEDRGRPRAGGPYVSGTKDIDETLGIGRRETVPDTALPAGAETLLAAGTAPLVVALPAGRGVVVVELALLDAPGDESLRARATLPLWVARTVRSLTARLHAPRTWFAGEPAPAAAELTRGAQTATVKGGDPLLLAPGAWTSPNGPVVVLANPAEGRLGKDAPSGSVATLAAALPERPGIDWGLPLLIAALLVAVGEGLVAAWAGRAYGR